MKKILIVNNNMKPGGVQKSLYNLLWEMEGRYDVTLVLFRRVGEYAFSLPQGVKVLECRSLFRYLGISQGECKTLRDKLVRGILAAVSRVLGRDAAMKLLLLSQKTLDGEYDCAISFLHNGRPKSFYGGAQDFVLHRVRARKKIAFLHCDYGRCGADHPANNRMLDRFDAVAACSEGCRDAFLRANPHMAEKCVTVRNFHRVAELRALADRDAVIYEENAVNLVLIARLAREKGIHRAVLAMKDTPARTRLHIIGGGPEETRLKDLVRSLGLSDRVRFYGEQGNPWRFLKYADLLLLTSFQEAAPMVLEEARCLGVPVLTVRTLSSEEMVTREGSGWVCENDQSALNEMLQSLLADPEVLNEKKVQLQGTGVHNAAAEQQFTALIGGDHESTCTGACKTE